MKNTPVFRWACLCCYIVSSVVLISILEGQESQTANLNQTQKRAISLIAVGDLMMGGSALSIFSQNGSDYAFDSLRIFLKSADLTMANLEAPFTTQGKPFDKEFTFRVPPDYAASLIHTGFDVLTLANNHILDYGREGLLSTFKILDSLNIHYCGAGENDKAAEKGCIIECGDWRIGFLAYSLTYPDDFWAASRSCGTAYPRPKAMKRCIRSMKQETDLIVVSFHWGGELMHYPKEYQRTYAHRAVDSGADLIIGHHPHVLQGVEIYRGKLIAYSLGNFVFGSYSQNVNESMIFKVRFENGGRSMAEIIPIDVNNYHTHFQPRLLRNRQKHKVLLHLNEISKPYNQGKDIIDDSGVIDLDKIL